MICTCLLIYRSLFQAHLISLIKWAEIFLLRKSISIPKIKNSKYKGSNFTRVLVFPLSYSSNAPNMRYWADFNSLLSFPVTKHALKFCFINNYQVKTLNSKLEIQRVFYCWYLVGPQEHVKKDLYLTNICLVRYFRPPLHAWFMW